MSQGKCWIRRRAGVLCMLLASMSSAHAAVAEGQWSGVLKGGDRALRVVATRDGERLTLRFGEPGNCVIPAAVLDEDAASAVFRFNLSTNGGAFCAALYPGEVRARSDGGTLHLAFTRKGLDWAGSLAPLDAP
jgi:hypothetical protein